MKPRLNVRITNLRRKVDRQQERIDSLLDYISCAMKRIDNAEATARVLWMKVDDLAHSAQRDPRPRRRGKAHEDQRPGAQRNRSKQRVTVSQLETRVAALEAHLKPS